LRDVNAKLDVDLSYGAYLSRFEDAMNDDFNMPIAFSVLFDVAKELNKHDKSSIEAQSLAGVLKNLGNILGILQNDPSAYLQGDSGQEEGFAEQVEALIAKRNQARTDKQWDIADMARDELTALGVVLEDSPSGTTWRKI
jgi:cysteinyl-tRNA synthetase